MLDKAAPPAAAASVFGGMIDDTTDGRTVVGPLALAIFRATKLV